ncbi:integrase catalytic subunit [Burkholderia pseudomallei]|nr:integrase catalytic subunit [Burkholderia pseudomallei]VBZ11810.1 integrase catalytic subunit [Burkholderia pseudomallei]
MKTVCEVLGVARSAVAVKRTRSSDWRDGRRARVTNDAGLVEEIQAHVAHLPTYGYRRVWALLRRSREQSGAPCINVKRVYRVMREHPLLLRRPGVRRDKRRHDGRVAVDRSNTRWCSDGFEFRCDDGTPLRVTFALDCCDREAMSWAATTGGHSGDVVRDVMLAAVEQRFGTTQAAQPIEWLTDNGSAYIDHRTRSFARELGLEPLTTPVRSPQSNGMAESFVKTMKHNYVAYMDKSDAPTALSRLAIALPDLRVQQFQINRRLVRRRTAHAEHVRRALLQLPFPFRDLVRVYIELLRQFGQCPLAFDRCQCHLRLNAAECVRRVLFVIFQVPLPALSLAQAPVAPLIRLSKFAQPPLSVRPHNAPHCNELATTIF